LGFLIVGAANIFPSLALYFFPQGSDSNKNGAIENGKVRKVTRESKKLKLFDKHVQRGDHEGGVKEFLNTYKGVVQSKVYDGAVFARVLDVLAFKGYMVFLPKYLENHYGIPQYRVHQFMAMFGVLGFASGTAVGGFLTRKLKLNGRKAALFIITVSILNMGLYFT
jgi:hypothetical protein